MKRKIWLDDNRFIDCEVTNADGIIDVYHFDAFTNRKDEIVNAIEKNGFNIKSIEWDAILVDRRDFQFIGEWYKLNQCSDIFEWFRESQVYEFTYYYHYIVFHHPDGKFYSADIDDTHNYIQI